MEITLNELPAHTAQTQSVINNLIKKHKNRDLFTQINLLEEQINFLLKLSWIGLEGDIQSSFTTLFSQGNAHRLGQGEKPTWSPNEAYMQSLEWMWQPVEIYLNGIGLGVDDSLRELFKESREYKDFTQEHRRVFYGQIISLEKQHPVTAFMLSVPHSHQQFCYPAPVTIHVDTTLLDNPIGLSA